MKLAMEVHHKGNTSPTLSLAPLGHPTAGSFKIAFSGFMVLGFLHYRVFRACGVEGSGLRNHTRNQAEALYKAAQGLRFGV